MEIKQIKAKSMNLFHFRLFIIAHTSLVHLVTASLQRQ